MNDADAIKSADAAYNIACITARTARDAARATAEVAYALAIEDANATYNAAVMTAGGEHHVH